MTNKINQKRQAISKLDQEILHLLSARFSLAKQIGQLKAAQAIPVEDKQRETDLIETYQRQFPALKEVIATLYPLIFHFSKEVQK